MEFLAVAASILVIVLVFSKVVDSLSKETGDWRVYPTLYFGVAIGFGWGSLSGQVESPIIRNALYVCVVVGAAFVYYVCRAIGRAHKRKRSSPTHHEKPITHPAAGTFCPHCGINHRTLGPCLCTDQQRALGGTCHLCGAGPDEPCDAGLHS